MLASDRIRRVLKVKPHPYQVPFLNSQATYRVATGGRRSGKTLMAELACLDTALSFPDCDALVFPANEAKGRELIRDMRRIVDRAGLRVAVDDTALTITFLGNGSRVRALPPTPGQARSEGARTMLVWIDEAGMQRRDLWSDVRYVLLDNLAVGACAILTGTPWGSREHFFYDSYRRGEGGDPDYESFRWPTALNPKVPKDWLARERSRLAAHEAAAELDGEWIEAGGSLFSHALLEANTADVELPDWRDLGGPARLSLGVDWGVRFDVSCAVAVGRLPVWSLNPDIEPRPVFGLVGLKAWAPRTDLSTVVHEVADNRARYSCVSPETNGVGEMPSQELRRLMVARAELEDWGFYFRPVNTSARLKADGYGRLLWLLEQHRLVLPRDPDLLRQLAGLRCEISDHGAMKIGADSPTVHDDVADALYLATGPRLSEGRVGSWLAGCATEYGPDAQVPEQAELVQTGGGLVVPRRPPVQSIDGSEVSLPDRDQAPNDGRPVEAEWLIEGRRRIAEAVRESQANQETEWRPRWVKHR